MPLRAFSRRLTGRHVAVSAAGLFPPHDRADGHELVPSGGRPQNAPTMSFANLGSERRRYAI